MRTPKPETIVVSVGTALLLTAVTLLTLATLGGHTELRRVAMWFFLGGVAVAFLPLLLLLSVLAYERVVGRKRRR